MQVRNFVQIHPLKLFVLVFSAWKEVRLQKQSGRTFLHIATYFVFTTDNSFNIRNYTATSSADATRSSPQEISLLLPHLE
jgi:hypothetical protein